MKLFSFTKEGEETKRLGMLLDQAHFDISSISPKLPATIDDALQDWTKNEKNLLELQRQLKQSQILNTYRVSKEEIVFHPPTVDRCTFRDFYAFQQHVETARALRGLKIIDEWFEIPVFYFSNANVFLGHNTDLLKPKNTNELDFELEIACIIGKPGQDIPLDRAQNYIAGYTILNDFSARDIQRKEMRVGLGPAKGKDFATGLGPYLVTADELTNLKKGKGYNLKMCAKKNGLKISSGNFADIYFGFNEMIARASEDVMLYPGDVIGSGTVGTGCILEVRPENTDGWLESGDVIELEIDHLGKLKHFIK